MDGIDSGSGDDAFDHRLERDPRFLQQIERARASLRAGKGVRVEDLDELLEAAEPLQSPEPTE